MARLRATPTSMASYRPGGVTCLCGRHAVCVYMYGLIRLVVFVIRCESLCNDLKHLVLPTNNTYSVPCVCIRWADGSNWNRRNAFRDKANCSVQLIPYSEHSNFPELYKFVRWANQHPTLEREQGEWLYGMTDLQARTMASAPCPSLTLFLLSAHLMTFACVAVTSHHSFLRPRCVLPTVFSDDKDRAAIAKRFRNAVDLTVRVCHGGCR